MMRSLFSGVSGLKTHQTKMDVIGNNIANVNDYGGKKSEINEEELKAKERELNEKMNQNKTFIKLLHQSELENNAEDVIEAIRQSSTGKKNMTSADWKQLYQANRCKHDIRERIQP